MMMTTPHQIDVNAYGVLIYSTAIDQRQFHASANQIIGLKPDYSAVVLVSFRPQSSTFTFTSQMAGEYIALGEILPRDTFK